MSSTFFSDDRSASQHALRGIAAVGGDRVAVHRDPVFVRATDPAPERVVALVSGGGAGHEPMHAGFLGRGGLDAAAPGEVFTSPHSRQIHAASAAVAKAGGVLHVVKNYTGDRINFAIAAERLKADGVAVTEVLVDDDLGSDGQAVGRRGTGATVVVEKILGAAADRGLGLDDLTSLGRAVVERSRSLAVAIRAHHAPGADDHAFEVEVGRVEYGVGIHGEAARESIENPGLEPLVSRMVGELLDALPATDAGVVVLVNSLGGTGQLELLHVLTEVERTLGERGVALRSAVAGTFISALDMSGFSITITAIDEDWLADWLAPHGTAGLPSPVVATLNDTAAPEGSGDEPAEASPWLAALAADIAALRDPLNALDQKAGDGDIGTNLDNGLQAALRRASGADADLAADLDSVATAFLEDVGGSSGPLFGLVLSRVASAARDGGSLVEGLRQGVEAVTRAGGATPGDRTMVDALHPAGWDGDAPRDAISLSAAAEGAAATADLVGRRGRSSYVGDRVLGVPDPGAVAVVAVLAAVVERAEGSDESAARAAVRDLTDA